MPGAVEALRTLTMGKKKIVIHSCRSLYPEGYTRIQEKITEIGLHCYPHLEFWAKEGKPIADLYVDDKGFRFEGDWGAVLRHPALSK